MFLFSKIIAKTGQTSRKRKHFDTDSNSNACEWVSDLVSANPWLCTVEESYINDNFNLYGLSNSVSDYQNALRVIRGHYYDISSSKSQNELMQSAKVLYGLIHARYLLTFNGVKEIQKKFEKGLYGYCPRVSCKNQPLLPIGLSPTPGEMAVKTYCPSCQDIYETDSKIDGAYFGPYFPHFFVQALKDEVTFQKPEPTQLSVFGIPIDPQSSMNRCKYVHPVALIP